MPFHANSTFCTSWHRTVRRRGQLVTMMASSTRRMLLSAVESGENVAAIITRQMSAPTTDLAPIAATNVATPKLTKRPATSTATVGDVHRGRITFVSSCSTACSLAAGSGRLRLRR